MPVRTFREYGSTMGTRHRTRTRREATFDPATYHVNVVRVGSFRVVTVNESSADVFQI
jgi:hypothetical protein